MTSGIKIVEFHGLLYVYSMDFSIIVINACWKSSEVYIKKCWKSITFYRGGTDYFWNSSIQGVTASILNLIAVENARLPSYSRPDTVGIHPVGGL